jgi:hypothetical protein
MPGAQAAPLGFTAEGSEAQGTTLELRDPCGRVVFPAICLKCAAPAAGRVEIGRAFPCYDSDDLIVGWDVRSVRVPICQT